MFLDVLEIVLGVFIVVLAFAAIQAKTLIKTVMFLSSLSMLSVLAFVFMHAPDVAITEAVIGSGLVTSLFVFTLIATKKEAKKS